MNHSLTLPHQVNNLEEIVVGESSFNPPNYTENGAVTAFTNEVSLDVSSLAQTISPRSTTDAGEFNFNTTNYTGTFGDNFVPIAEAFPATYDSDLYSGPLTDKQYLNGYCHASSGVSHAISDLASAGGSYALHPVQGAFGFGGYTQPAISARGQISIYESPSIYGHDNTPLLPMNVTGSNFIEPHFSTNSAINPIIPRLGAINDAQSQFDIGGFAAINGYSNNYLPTMTSYGPDFMAHPQYIPNGVITTTVISPPTMTASIPLMNPAPAVPSATAAGARPACTICGKTYSRLSELKRHEKKHLPGAKKFDCPSNGCRYTGAMGFLRKDKMRDHVRNMHPEIDARRL